MRYCKKLLIVLVVYCILSISMFSYADTSYSSTITLRTFTTGATISKHTAQHWGRMIDQNSYIYYLDNNNVQSSSHDQYVQFVTPSGTELSERECHSQGYFGIDEEELKTGANNYNEAKMKVTNWHYVDQGNSNTTYRLFCGGEIAAILYSIGS